MDGPPPYFYASGRAFYLLLPGVRVSSRFGLLFALIFSFFMGLLSSVIGQYTKTLDYRRPKGALSHAMRMLTLYLCIILVSTMNIFVLIAIVCGHAVGHAVFALKREKSVEMELDYPMAPVEVLPSIKAVESLPSPVPSPTQKRDPPLRNPFEGVEEFSTTRRGNFTVPDFPGTPQTGGADTKGPTFVTMDSTEFAIRRGRPEGH